MKKAFTIIELIFVIVIIGILAAVAIPKLAATRDDAKISSIIANARTALVDMTAHYTAQGKVNWIGGANQVQIEDATNVYFHAVSCAAGPQSGNVASSTLLLCDETGGDACITFSPDTNGTEIVVATATVGTSTICDGVLLDPVITAMSSNTYKLGISAIAR